MPKHIITYGSLRKGQYNFNYFPSLKHVKTTTIKGYDLYSLGAYPGVKKGDGTLVVDLLEVHDDRDFSNIRGMEVGANYTPIELEIDGIKGEFYLYNGYVDPSRKVESGDWAKHLAR